MATDRQIDKLKAKPHVVVGSPGRIVELIERGKLKTVHIRAVVIDEADRLLNEESLQWIQKNHQRGDAGPTGPLGFSHPRRSSSRLVRS